MANNYNSIPLVRTWKSYLQAYPSRSLLSLKSLWELIYDSEGYFLIDRADIQGIINTNIGCSLDHDIICYSNLEYATGSASENNISYDNTSISKERAYELLGIDVSIASYDPRAKVRKVELENNELDASKTIDGRADVGTTTIFNKGYMECHDRDSVLEPSDMYDFIRHGVYVTDKPADINPNVEYYGINNDTYIAPYVSPLSSSEAEHTAPIYLNKSDTAFRGTLTVDNTLEAYNKIILNPHSNTWVSGLVIKALHEQIKYVNQPSPGGFLNAITDWIGWRRNWGQSDKNPNNLRNFVFATIPSIIDDQKYSTNFKVNPNGNWADLLKHTFVWIKAPFFGDYIQPDVFNQDLTNQSDVAHKNLIISDIADFRKYDVSTSKENKLDTMSYPYVPVTAPGYDILSPRIYNKINGTDIEHSSLTRLNTASGIEKVIEEGDKNEDSLIGSIRFAPALVNADRAATGKLNILPNYFDPEANYEETDFNITSSSKFHMPTIVPSSGNIYTDGRIISPTIDELWVYIKTLTEGRRADNSSGENLSPSEWDIARPTGSGNKAILNQDTILSAATNEYDFTLKGTDTNVTGDITNVDVEYDSENKQYKVSPIGYVNNNNQIKYNIFDALKRISRAVTTFDLKPENVTSREITNFTAWSKLYNEEDEEKDARVADTEEVAVNPTSNNIWQPRNDAPYSLRELEALNQGNKYNIITLARFVEENYTVAGGLGYLYKNDEDEESIGTEGGIIQAGGSLYQFHREYNYKVSNPNTFFRKNGANKPLFNEDGTKNITDSGSDATFNDLTSPDHTDESTIKIYNPKAPFTEGKIKTSKMPLLVENYGKSVYLNTDFGDYSGADIYMAADGTWRYKSEHSRIPILRSRY